MSRVTYASHDKARSYGVPPQTSFKTRAAIIFIMDEEVNQLHFASGRIEISPFNSATYYHNIALWMLIDILPAYVHSM